MEELYKQNSKIVYYFLYSMCKDEELAEELLQETFLKGFESLERFDGSCKISTWLCQIAKHLLYQHWNRVQKEFVVELDDKLTTKVDTEMQAIQRVELADIWDKLQQMPEDMRQVVSLRVMSDLSFKEIGAIVGKSENWARVIFFRAKKQLLKEGHYEDTL